MATTRDLLQVQIREHPEWTATEHARLLGVTRERIRQLAASIGVALPSGSRRPKTVRPRPPFDASVTGPSSVSSSSVRGTIGELIAAADMMARRFTVFAPLSRSAAACDLIGISRDGRHVVRVEVRTGKRRSGRLIYSRHGVPEKRDHLAIVVEGGPVEYIPPLPDVR